MIDRVQRKIKIETTGSKNNVATCDENLLEIECPNKDRDLPLFSSLRFFKVPFDIVKTLIDETTTLSGNNLNIVHATYNRLISWSHILCKLQEGQCQHFVLSM